MADSGGHWKTLAEAQKLTQSTLIPGRFEEDVKRNNPLDLFPVTQASKTGSSIKWLREKNTIEDAVSMIDIGEQLSWTEDVEYETVETELKRIYLQRKLDNFVEDIYGNINDYKAMKLMECEKGLRYKVGDQMLYGDLTYGSSKQFNGLHRLVAYNKETYTLFDDDLNIDNGEAGLSMRNLRLMIDAMRFGCDVLLFPKEIAQRVDEMWEDRGSTSLASGTANSLMRFARGIDQWGMPITYFNGIPIVRTDFLVAEQANTGTGASSDTRAKNTSGDEQFSIFGIKFGNPVAGDPGATLAFGNTTGKGQFYKLVLFPQLEDYDAGGIRLISYLALLHGSMKSIGRIYDIEDAACTA